MHFDCKQKGFSAILVLVGILILGAIGGAYYFGKSSNKVSAPVVSQPQNTIPPTTRPEDTANPDSIGANWEIYENKAWGISFKYPNDYKVDSENDQEISLSSSYGDNQRVPKSFVITKNLTNLSEIKLCQNGTYSTTIPCFMDKIETTVDNRKAIRFGLFYSGGGFGSSGRVQLIQEPKIEIYAIIYGGGGEARFNQILSTFKFIP